MQIWSHIWLFTTTSLAAFRERSEYKVLTIVYKALHKMAPEYLSDHIIPYSTPRALRSQDKLLLRPQRFHNNYGARSFKCMAPKLWNDLPFSLRSVPSFHVFCKRILKLTYFVKHILVKLERLYQYYIYLINIYLLICDYGYQYYVFYVYVIMYLMWYYLYVILYYTALRLI